MSTPLSYTQNSHLSEAACQRRDDDDDVVNRSDFSRIGKRESRVDLKFRDPVIEELGAVELQLLTDTFPRTFHIFHITPDVVCTPYCT